jgi:hypothetical protein
LSGRPRDPHALDVKSGIQGGRVLLAPGTNYSSGRRRGRSDTGQGKAPISGGTNARRASIEKSRSGE